MLHWNPKCPLFHNLKFLGGFIHLITVYYSDTLTNIEQWHIENIWLIISAVISAVISALLYTLHTKGFVCILLINFLNQVHTAGCGHAPCLLNLFYSLAEKRMKLAKWSTIYFNAILDCPLYNFEKEKLIMNVYIFNCTRWNVINVLTSTLYLIQNSSALVFWPINTACRTGPRALGKTKISGPMHYMLPIYRA